MSRRRGNDYENQVCDMANALGYCSFPARGSRGVVDVVCFMGEDACRCEYKGSDHLCMGDYLRTLAIQVGTTAKPIAATLAELDAAPRPLGSLCVVARRIRAKNRRISWQFNTAAGKFTTLAEAVDAR